MNFQTISCDDFMYNMAINGFCVFPKIVPENVCERMKASIFEHYEDIRPIQVQAKMGDLTAWGVHHIVGKRDGIHDFLESDYLSNFIGKYFGDKPYILNSCSSPINPPRNEAGQYEHGHRWHRDIRTFVGEGNRQLLVMLVMVDAFTNQNGATEVIAGTHRLSAFPSETFVKANTRQAEGPRGSIILMDGDVWHRAGRNQTNEFRVGLTCTWTRPFFKQQLDYPRFLRPEYADGLSLRMRQLFGFNARTPSSYEEWYQPAENRFYRADQE